MTVFSTRRLAVLMLLAALALTLSGCWNPFAPDEGDPVEIPPADYHERLTPEDVIHNLKTAYVYKNADEYLDCLSEDFIFFPSEDDLQNPDPQNPMPDEWYKTDEAEMHNNMFTGDDAVESITLTLTHTTIEHDEGDPGDPLDDIYIYVEAVDLMVNLYGDQSYLATAPSEYWFRVDTDQSGENGEIWWEIYLWFDLSAPDPGRGDGARQDPNVERVSYGQLKNLFR
jgi:hypothetical protein